MNDKEKELLKEFVEWYKVYLNDLEKYEINIYNDVKTNGHEDNAAFFMGNINMLERLLRGIDLQFELFLKEREK